MNLGENKVENGWDGREKREGEIVHYILISKHLKYVFNAKMCTLSICHSFNLHNQWQLKLKLSLHFASPKTYSRFFLFAQSYGRSEGLSNGDVTLTVLCFIFLIQLGRRSVTSANSHEKQFLLCLGKPRIIQKLPWELWRSTLVGFFFPFLLFPLLFFLLKIYSSLIQYTLTTISPPSTPPDSLSLFPLRKGHASKKQQPNIINKI